MVEKSKAPVIMLPYSATGGTDIVQQIRDSILVAQQAGKAASS